jgi:hypothetical protein
MLAFWSCFSSDGVSRQALGHADGFPCIGVTANARLRGIRKWRTNQPPTAAVSHTNRPSRPSNWFMWLRSIAIVDLHLLGLASTKHPFRELAPAVLPWTWAAFVIAAVAGALLFISQATEYASKTVFQVKFFIMLLAGVNMLVFELITARRAQEWQIRSRSLRWPQDLPE